MKGDPGRVQAVTAEGAKTHLAQGRTGTSQGNGLSIKGFKEDLGKSEVFQCFHDSASKGKREAEGECGLLPSRNAFQEKHIPQKVNNPIHSLF